MYKAGRPAGALGFFQRFVRPAGRVFLRRNPARRLLEGPPDFRGEIKLDQFSLPELGMYKLELLFRR